MRLGRSGFQLHTFSLVANWCWPRQHANSIASTRRMYTMCTRHAADGRLCCCNVSTRNACIGAAAGASYSGNVPKYSATTNILLGKSALGYSPAAPNSSAYQGLCRPRLVVGDRQRTQQIPSTIVSFVPASCSYCCYCQPRSPWGRVVHRNSRPSPLRRSTWLDLLNSQTAKPIKRDYSRACLRHLAAREIIIRKKQSTYAKVTHRIHRLLLNHLHIRIEDPRKNKTQPT